MNNQTQDSTDPTIKRINSLIRSSKITWFALLSFIPFTYLTMATIEDVSFFIESHGVDLPLVGISVPTLAFFAITPVFGSLLYAHLHLKLLTLWEEIEIISNSADLSSNNFDQAVYNQIDHWTVADMCLQAKGIQVDEKPLGNLSRHINAMLVFWSTPLVIALVWWQSMTPHIAWLTILCCGLPLAITTYISVVSWYTMRGDARGKGQTCYSMKRLINFILRRYEHLIYVLPLLITAVSWIRIDGASGFISRSFRFDNCNWKPLSYLNCDLISAAAYNIPIIAVSYFIYKKTTLLTDLLCLKKGILEDYRMFERSAIFFIPLVSVTILFILFGTKNDTTPACQHIAPLQT